MPVSKKWESWDTKEDTGKSIKHALYVRTVVCQSHWSAAGPCMPACLEAANKIIQISLHLSCSSAASILF